MPKALVGLVEKMPRRKPPVVEEETPEDALEGEPEEEMDRGGGEEEELEEGAPPPDEEEAPGGQYDEHFEMALDDVADIVGVSPEDRADFGTAMKALIHCVVGDALRSAGNEEESEEEVEEEDEGEPVEE